MFIGYLMLEDNLLLVYILVWRRTFGLKVSTYLTFGSRGYRFMMAQKTDIKAPPALREDVPYENWKKEINIW